MCCPLHLMGLLSAVPLLSVLWVWGQGRIYHHAV